MKISIYLLFSTSVRVDFKSYWDFRNSWFSPSHCILLYVNINNWHQSTNFILIKSDKLVHNPLMLRSLEKMISLDLVWKNEWGNKENGISFSLLLSISCLVVPELYQRFLQRYQAHRFLTFQLLEIWD